MSHTPNYDQKVKAILDALQPGERTCALTGEKWMMDEEEIKWYRHFNVPPSVYSLMTRWYRMGGMAVGFEWWWNQHAETGKPMLTYVHPATGIRVLPDVEWYQKDFTSQARVFDPHQSFFKQMLELRKAIPVVATFNIKEPENSISLLSYGDVNSYFTIACQGRNTLYASDAFATEDSAEVYAVKYATRCYRIVYGERLYNCRSVYHSFDCRDSAFLFDCRNCESCFGATNQRNKKYLWFNEQLTKETYEQRLAAVDLSRRSVYTVQEQAFYQLVEQQGFWPENFNEKTTESIGDYLRNADQCRVAFHCVDGPRDNAWVSYCYGDSQRNFMFCGPLGSDNYFGVSVLEGAKNLFAINLTRCFNTEYSINCIDCESCFGCVGLYKKKYCIFNKQYREDEYWQKLDELKCALLDRGEYGEYFPPEFSTSYFLESVPGINYGATKVDREKYGFPSFDPESAGAIGVLGESAMMKDASLVPDAIVDVSVQAWAGVPMMDKEAGRRFTYLKPELELYKLLGVPAPTNHFIARVDNLYHMANLFLLEDVACHQCQKPLQVAKNITFKNRKHLCREDYLTYLQSR